MPSINPAKPAALVQNAPTITPTASYYAPLSTETRTHVTTDVAAHHLSRRPQTLRAWSCLDNGPIRAKRINGRLAWLVSDIRALLGEVTA